MARSASNRNPQIGVSRAIKSVIFIDGERHVKEYSSYNEAIFCIADILIQAGTDAAEEMVISITPAG